MGIPLAALAVRPPEQPPDQMSQMGKALQLKQMMAAAPYQQQQMQQQLQQGQQNLQTGALENQQRQYNMAATQAVNKSYKDAIKPDSNGVPQIDTDALQKSLADSGYGSESTKILEGVTKFQESKNALLESQNKLKTQGQDMLGGAASAIQTAKYDPRLAHTILDTLPPNPQIDALRQKIDGDPAAFKQLIDSAVAQSPKQQEFANAQKIAQIRAGNESNQVMQDWLAKNPGKGPADFDAYKEQQKVDQAIKIATNPQIQAGKIQVATAEGQAKSNIETAAARGSDAALANVSKPLIVPATAAAEKANKEFADAKSVSDRMNATMDAARKGNVVSYQIIPEEGTLQITTSQGVHRINKTEIDQYAGGGSLWQRMEGHFGKALTGQSIPDSVMKDMAEIQKIQAQGAKSRYENTLTSVNQTYGSQFKPVEMKGLGDETPAPAAHPFFSKFGGTARPQ
jgi:hypothetical protein